ncbi:MAG: hypothetical protein DLM72_16460 [Candidatus Nitrosopolaris wilkensis]|nr:MAG: hypothetical protein DLM72_16460 [Candidatus Nitrosopolaris wilkensis]
MSSSIDESSNQINDSSLKEYEQHSYEELSQEFKELYPAATRAFQLIPLMYNRLTLVNRITHKDAIAKIQNDHQHLAGFTERNIRRYLPTANPNLPRRVRTPCPKNSITEIQQGPYFSNSQHENHLDQNQNVTDDVLEDQLKETKLGEQEHNRSNDKTSSPHTLEQGESAPEKKVQTRECNISTQIRDRYELVAFEFSLEWDSVADYMNVLYKSENTSEVWFNGELDKRTGKVISADTGRKEDHNRTSEEGH